jgi:ATP-dependent Clp protease adaptor protein ClpS
MALSGYILASAPAATADRMMDAMVAPYPDWPHAGPDKDDDDDSGNTPGGAVVTRTRPKTQRPSMYKVLLLNDDYTPMEFVVHVLERFFGLNNAQAVEIMLTVHRKGVAVVGVFSYEIAETKVTQVMEYARRNQHPLQCTMEKE